MEINSIITLKRYYEHSDLLFNKSCPSVLKLEMKKFEEKINNNSKDIYNLKKLYKHLRTDEESLKVVYDEITKGKVTVIESYKKELFKYNEEILKSHLDNSLNKIQDIYAKSNPETYIYTLKKIILDKDNGSYSIKKEKEYVYFITEPTNFISFFTLLEDIVKKKGKFAVIGVLSPDIIKYAKNDVYYTQFLIAQLLIINQLSYKYNIVNDLIIPYSIYNSIWCSSYNMHYEKGKYDLIEMFKTLKKSDKNLEKYSLEEFVNYLNS